MRVHMQKSRSERRRADPYVRAGFGTEAKEKIAIIDSLRIMTTAYLFHRNHVLLMRRSPTRKFMPGIWTGIGGHLEAAEHGNLRCACLREIEEETGLRSEDVEELALRYVILRQSHKELRQQFVYFGRTAKTELSSTDEGTLHWIPRTEIFHHQMSESNRFMLLHYFENHDKNAVFVGTMREEQFKLNIDWVAISDWELGGAYGNGTDQ